MHCLLISRLTSRLPQNSIIIVDKLEFETNPAIGNLSFVFKEHHTYGQVVNATIQSFVTATNGLVYVSINFPDDENDQKYQKQFLRTSFDVQKVLKGIYSNPIAKNFIQNLNDSIDFELKLPFKPVRENRMNEDLLTFMISEGLQVVKFPHVRCVHSDIHDDKRKS